MNKEWTDLDRVVADIPDGATVMIGGFGAAGHPANLIRALLARGPRDLTVIGNAFTELMELVAARRVRKAISSYPQPARRFMAQCPVEDQVKAGELEIELVPEGTLAERIQAAGVGIPAFYCPVGAGTALEVGKEVRYFDGKRCLLETALSADFALLKGYKADRFGNVIYRKAARNINPQMAKAAKTTIFEVEEIVPPGEIDPEVVVTPGVYVDRVIRRDKIGREFVVPYFLGNVSYLQRFKEES